MNLCMIATYVLSSVLLVTFITSHKTNPVFATSIVLSVLNLLVYLLCAFMNPGIYTARREIPDNEIINCEVWGCV